MPLNWAQTFVVTRSPIIQAAAQKPDQFKPVGVSYIPVPGGWRASGSRREQLSLSPPGLVSLLGSSTTHTLGHQMSAWTESQEKCNGWGWSHCIFTFHSVVFGFFFCAGFLLLKGRILPVPGTAVPEAAQWVLYCQHSVCCSSWARYGREKSHKRHPVSYLENKESLLNTKRGCRHTLGCPKASSRSLQRNHRWARWVTALLVGQLTYPLWQSIPSAARSREGREESSRTETVTIWICPWVYFRFHRTRPWLQSQTQKISPKACVIVLIIFLFVECFLEAVTLQVLASKWFIVLCILLFIAKYLLLANLFCGSCTDRNVWLWFFLAW